METAAGNGDIDFVKQKLLEGFNDINALLSCACEGGEIEMVRFLRSQCMYEMPGRAGMFCYVIRKVIVM